MPTSNEVEDQIVASIRRIIRAIDLQSRRLLDQHKLTGPQLATLREADKLGEISVSTLARAVHLSQPTVSGILNRLERRGLVVRLQLGRHVGALLGVCRVGVLESHAADGAEGEPLRAVARARADAPLLVERGVVRHEHLAVLVQQ